MKTHIKRQILLAVLATLMVCGIFGAAEINSFAAAEDADTSASLSSVADGVYATSNGSLACYMDGAKVGAGWHLLSNPVESLTSGKTTVSGNVYYYVASTGYVTRAYYVSTQKCSNYSSGTWTALKNTYCTLYDGKVYYFNSSGVRVTSSGWKNIGNNTLIYVCSSGYVTGKMAKSDNVWRYYIYSYTSKSWVQQKSKWVTVGSNSYYMNGSGYSGRAYYGSKGTCYNYSGGKWVQVKNSYCTLSDSKAYYFNSSGVRVTSSGWKNIGNNTLIYVCSSGYVTGKMAKSDNVWRYYIYSYTSKSWVQQKSKWVTVGSNSYYMNGSGYSGRAYYGSTKTCYNYSGGKWVQVKNSYCTLSDSKAYYFNSSGVRVTTTGWKNLGNNTLIYVGGSGYVTAKMVKSSNVWRYYVYNYTSKAWTLQKSKWVTVGSNSYYMNSSGYSSRAYYASTRKCYNYTSGSWVLFKNNICTLQDGNVYYFNSSGVRVSTAGTYTTSSGVKVVTDSTGMVTKTYTYTYQYITIDLGDGETTTVYGYYDEEMADELVDMLNDYRTEQGVDTLEVSTELTEAAQTRSAEISYYFSHDRPNGDSCFDLSSEMYGENIAAGYTTADAVMTGWKNSSGHNANMLNAGYNTIGISVFVAVSGDNEGYGIYYVQDFGY